MYICFRYEGFENRSVRIRIKNILAESLDVKPDRGFDILQCFPIGVPLADDHTFQSERVGDISVRVMLHHDFNCAVHVLMLLCSHRNYAIPVGDLSMRGGCVIVGRFSVSSRTGYAEILADLEDEVVTYLGVTRNRRSPVFDRVLVPGMLGSFARESTSIGM